MGAPFPRQKSTIGTARCLPKARGRGGRGGGSSGQRVRGRWMCVGKRGARCGARAGRGQLTLRRGRHVEQGASRRREPSERWSRRRPATGNRTPTPDDHLAARGAQPAGARHGTGRHKHQSKQRRHADLSRRMPPACAAARLPAPVGAQTCPWCLRSRWGRKHRRHLSKKSRPGPLLSCQGVGTGTLNFLCGGVRTGRGRWARRYVSAPRECRRRAGGRGSAPAR